MVCRTTGEGRSRVLGPRWLASTFVLLTLGVAGCLFVPIPDKGPDPIPDPALQFLEADGTTRNDVLDQLGEPNWRFDDYRVFAYDGIRVHGTMYWGYFIASTWGAGSAGVGSAPIRKRKTLYIAFNEHWYVVASSVQTPSVLINRSIRGQVEEWTEHEHIEHSDVDFSVPPGQSVIVFYRPGGIFDYGTADVQVRVDGVTITQLQEETYLPIVVEPGKHDIQIVPINHFGEDDPNHSPAESSITTSSDETVYLWVRVGSAFSYSAKLKIRPESEAREKLGELGLISPPPAYAGW